MDKDGGPDTTRVRFKDWCVSFRSQVQLGVLTDFYALNIELVECETEGPLVHWRKFGTAQVKPVRDQCYSSARTTWFFSRSGSAQVKSGTAEFMRAELFVGTRATFIRAVLIKTWWCKLALSVNSHDICFSSSCTIGQVPHQDLCDQRHSSDNHKKSVFYVHTAAESAFSNHSTQSTKTEFPNSEVAS